MTTKQKQDSSKAKPDEQKKLISANLKKWGPELMNAGWNAIPNTIILRQTDLGLDALDLNILMHLTSFWWHADNLPHPAVKTLADGMGVKPRTIQRHIKRMEENGLIKRQLRGRSGKSHDTNCYDFAGLIKAAKPLAQQKLDEAATKEGRKRQGAKPHA